MTNITAVKKAVNDAEIGCTWSVRIKKEVKILLSLKYKDAPETAETVQMMLDEIIPKYGNDREAVSDLIISFFMHRG